ncbi:MAG: UDP-glucose/GDP-mannose dehydrogenase family protein [Bacteroidota bacterium]|nr:UDP-glucose/GDP-mannose dehydrogenase family protein [Candidatus Kapabacteria bacterium]MDW8271542.1 UDP-glucose/GDP-mannose dehydrogenase family protein [Bacteroidota bacterium]
MALSVAVIGTGYVGLVSGVCFAEQGNTVWCMDVDRAKLDRLQRGESPIYEPGLEPLLQRNLAEGRLHFTDELQVAVRNAEVIFLCLPTPPDEDGSADLRYVLETAKQIATIVRDEHIQERRIIVNRSTVPVGTADKVRQIANEVAPTSDIRVASNPEFLSEGNAVQQTLMPDRVVIGSRDPEVIAVLSELYRPFVDEYSRPLLVMDERSAEVTKYASNAFLALRISFMNEMSMYCEAVGADVELVRLGMSFDPRIGQRYLYPGLGFGGSCLPKDIRALYASAQQVGLQLQLVEAAAVVNRKQLERFVRKIVERFGGSITGRTFGVWGLAFKPNTDDVREAPAHALIRALIAQGAHVCAYDPAALETSRQVLGDIIKYASSMYDAVQGADALILATEWGEFHSPDWNKVKASMRGNIIFDGRNVWRSGDLIRYGFEYHSIGRTTYLPGGG